MALSLAGPYSPNDAVLLGLGLRQRVLDDCRCAVRKACELGSVLTSQ